MPRAQPLSPNRRVQLRLGAALAIAEELAKRLERFLREELQIDETSDMTLAELGLDDAVIVTMQIAYGHLASEEALEHYGIDGGRFLSVEIGTTATSRVTREYITGGRFLSKGHSGDDYQSLEIDLWNGSVAAELHEGNRTLLTELEDTLAHELTHAIDPKVRRDDPYVSPFASRGGNMQGYLTQLVERKAFGQSMALRVLRCMAARGAARDDARAFDECAAAAVDEPFLALSPKQQQRSLRDLYDAVQSVDIHEAIDVLADHPAVGRRREREAGRRRSAHDEWIARITADMRRDIAALLEEHGQVWLHSIVGDRFPTVLLSVRSGIAPAVALEFPGGDPDRPKRYRSVDALLDDLPPLWRFPRESEDFWHDEPWTALADAQEVSDGYHEIVGQFALTANGSGFGSRDDFDAWLRWAKREDAAWKAEVQRVYEESGGVYIEDGADWYWLVYPSTRPDCRVQATSFARADDTPRGHYCAESIGALLGESPPVIFPRLGRDASKTWRDVSVVRPMTYRNNGRAYPVEVGNYLYHGTRLEHAERIAEEGFRLDKAVGRGLLLGPAIYLTDDLRMAEGYARGEAEDGNSAAILVCRLHDRVLYGTDPDYWWPEQLDRIPEITGATLDELRYGAKWPLLGRAVRKLGGQALRVGSVIAVYNPMLVEVIEVLPYEAEEP